MLPLDSFQGLARLSMAPDLPVESSGGRIVGRCGVIQPLQLGLLQRLHHFQIVFIDVIPALGRFRDLFQRILDLGGQLVIL